MVCVEIAAYILAACLCGFSGIAAYRDRNMKIGFKISVVCYLSAVFLIAIIAIIVTLSELL